MLYVYRESMLSIGILLSYSLKRWEEHMPLPPKGRVQGVCLNIVLNDCHGSAYVIENHKKNILGSEKG